MPRAKSKGDRRTKMQPAAKQVKHPSKRVGRPRAKHSNPDYVQMSLYIHRNVRNKVKARLFEQGMEFSALVEFVLRDWLSKQV
jgi:hypothetical protein